MQHQDWLDGHAHHVKANPTSKRESPKQGSNPTAAFTTALGLAAGFDEP